MRRWFLFALIAVVAVAAGAGVALASSTQEARRLTTSQASAIGPPAHRAMAADPARLSGGRSHVFLATSDADPVPGERVSLRGRVIPSHPGDRILLQRRDANGWKTVATPTVSARSRFSTSLRLAKPGHLAFRAVLPARARDRGSQSRPVSLVASEIHKIKHVVI